MYTIDTFCFCGGDNVTGLVEGGREGWVEKWFDIADCNCSLHSDSDSDAESFYGSIESPMNITHVAENPEAGKRKKSFECHREVMMEFDGLLVHWFAFYIVLGGTRVTSFKYKIRLLSIWAYAFLS